MPSQGYVRFPTIFRDWIVFVAEDDLWLLSTEGDERSGSPQPRPRSCIHGFRLMGRTWHSWGVQRGRVKST